MRDAPPVRSFVLLCGSQPEVLIQVKFEPVFSGMQRLSPRGARAGFKLASSGLECLQICNDIRDLIGIEPELRHRRMVGNNAFGQAPAQALDREFEMQCAERGRDGERTVADGFDGMALRAI